MVCKGWFTGSIIKLFNTFILENPDIDVKKLQVDLYKACNTMISHGRFY